LAMVVCPPPILPSSIRNSDGQSNAASWGTAPPRPDGAAERGRRADPSEGDARLLTTREEIDLWMTAPTR
jgi:hypothetical protein